ncbi:hypothetical protein GCK32_016384 [Trichostrongylus colubriformis]|uniref:Uncharacterized protein n=1 Tax=Trichostrongylus colubriformis TaxID=6319 RepID=A0AAN8J0T4_TRICO
MFAEWLLLLCDNTHHNSLAKLLVLFHIVWVIDPAVFFLCVIMAEAVREFWNKVVTTKRLYLNPHEHFGRANIFRAAMASYIGMYFLFRWNQKRKARNLRELQSAERVNILNDALARAAQGNRRVNGSGQVLAVMVELDVNKENEEEPNFSDPEDFVDDITDEGITRYGCFAAKTIYG